MAARALICGLTALGLAGLTFGTAPSLAAPPPNSTSNATSDQGDAPLNEVRALNLARNEAVRLNGGLSVYRPASCMFSTSARSNPCLIRSDAKGFVYRFRGGVPGWESQKLAPSTETEIRIAADGRSVVKVIYNGVPR